MTYSIIISMRRKKACHYIECKNYEVMVQIYSFLSMDSVRYNEIEMYQTNYKGVIKSLRKAHIGKQWH